MSRILKAFLIVLLFFFSIACGLIPNLAQSANSSDVWNGIPIPPQATLVNKTKTAYSFTTTTSVEEVQTYFRDELKTLGWTTISDDPGLMFEKKEGKVLEITILSGSPNNVSAVLILH